MKKKLNSLLLISLSFLTMYANGHHSFPGIYDVSQKYVLEGVVSKFRFRNPHSFIMLDVNDSNGNVTTWALELPPSWALRKGGVHKELIQEGDELLVVCNPSRDGSNACGLGQKGGFYRISDGLLFGKDPREVKQAANR